MSVLCDTHWVQAAARLGVGQPRQSFAGRPSGPSVERPGFDQLRAWVSFGASLSSANGMLDTVADPSAIVMS